MKLHETIKLGRMLVGVLLACSALSATRSLAAEPTSIPPVSGPISSDFGSDYKPSPCPASDQLSKWFHQINSIRADISLGDRVAPPDCSTDLFRSGGHGQMARHVAVTKHSWVAPEMWHQPVYFDDVPLEQYGQAKHPALQPPISMGRFFVSIPAMPYKIIKDPPFSCVSTLGKYRPGSCAPCILQVPR